MARTSTEQPRPALTVSRDEARKRIQQQIDRAKEVPNVSINENDVARRWYEYTAERVRGGNSLPNVVARRNSIPTKLSI